MKDLIRGLFARYLFPALLLIWILIWVLPWKLWMESLPWIRLGIGLFIFVIPGFTLSLLLMNRRITIPAHVTTGLAISIFIVGLLGLLGRIFHYPFTFIKVAFVLLGLVCLLLLTKYSLSGEPLYRPKKISIATIIILLFPMVVGFIIALKGGLELDDYSYMAYLTTWQHSQALDFKDVFFGLDNVGQVRFWMAMLPMSEALLSEISNIHGLLLIGYYLEPALVIFAILAAYSLYEDFLPSAEYAAFALLLHFTILIISEPGDLLFHHLTQDKAFAAFILTPTFFLAAHHFLETFTVRCGLFFLLIGFGLTLTHPIMLAFSAFVIALYTIVVTLITGEYKKLGIVFLLLVITIFPVGLLRFIGVPWISQNFFTLESVIQQPGSFDFESASGSRRIQELVSNIPGTPFYGFNPHRVQLVSVSEVKTAWLILISWIYLYILVLGLIWSFFKLKRNNTAPFIYAASLLVLLALIPYTGWLMGYFVSARMLWRTPWVYPIGLTTTVLTMEVLEVVKQKILSHRISKPLFEYTSLTLISILCIKLILGHPDITFDGKLSLLPHRDHYITRLTVLSRLGDYLETTIEEPSIFLAPQELMYYLPGLSSKSKVVFFREERFDLHPVDEQQLELFFSTNKQISVEQRIEILEQYKVQYILVNDDSIRTFYAKDPHFTNIINFGNFGILKFVDKIPQ